MKNNKLKAIILIVVAVLVCSLAVGFIVSTTSSNRSSSSSLVSRGSNKTYTQLYSHHFDVVLSLDQLGFSSLDPDNTCCAVINFNVLSNNPTPYAKLSDMEGDGYIASAFGRFVPLDPSVSVSSAFSSIVLEARLVYDGTVWIYATSVTGNHPLIDYGRSFFIPNMANFVVQDSVSAV